MPPKIEPVDGEFYWLRVSGKPFIAEYAANNRDRNGAAAGSCFWVGIAEVYGDVEVLQHIPKPGNSCVLIRTGQKVAFLDVSIGAPFYAHDRFWTRSDFDAATEIHETRDRLASSCNFLMDGTVKPQGDYGPTGRICEEVEAVDVQGNPEQ